MTQTFKPDARRWIQPRAMLIVLLAFTAGTACVAEDEALTVDAGPDLYVFGGGGPVSIDLVAVLNQDPSFVEFLWFRVDGPALIDFVPEDEDHTLATFPEPGIYTVRVRAKKSDTEIAFDDVTVVVGPILVQTQVSRSAFKAFGAGTPRSSLSFKMFGVDAGDGRLALEPGDKMTVIFDGVEVGRLSLPQDPDDDFLTLDFLGRARASNEKTGGTFDAVLNSTFKRVKMRYKPTALGEINFKATGGDFDTSLVPPATATPTPIILSVIMLRHVSGIPLQVSYENEVGMIVIDKNGVLRGTHKP